MVYSILLAVAMAGDWQVVFHQQGGTQYWLLHLDQDGDKVTGALAGGGIKFNGSIHGDVLEMELREGTRPPGKFKATVKGAAMSGEGEDPDGPFTFTASRPAVREGAPRTLKFTPTQFHNYFSSKIEPVSRIFPGDTVETKSVDAGGVDEKGERRAPGGNPLTGPFYVEGAWPGDTLVVKLVRLRLNRDSAGSGRSIVPSALGPGYFRNQKMDNDFSSQWTLDREKGVARLTKPSEHLKNYTVPLKPMLGCIGVAPPQEQSFRSGYLGPWGGNMDYNQFGEGVTLYLPVFHPGALLFLGDGHAAQGDGEVSGLAIECPMQRVEIAVRVREDLPLEAPIAETALGTLTFGFGETLDDAAARAVDGMLRLLAARHGLARADALALASVCVDLRVTQIVNRIVGVHAVLSPGAFAGA